MLRGSLAHRLRSLRPRNLLTGSWLGLATAVCIAGVGVGGLLALNSLAKDAHVTEEVLIRLELEIARLHGWEVRVVSGQSRPDEVPTVRGRIDDMTRDADQLQKLGGSQLAAARLATALTNYGATLDEELQQFALDDTNAPALFQEDRLTTRYRAVADALPRAQSDVRAWAESVSWLVAAGLVATLLGALISIALLVWGLERARRASERQSEARFRSLVQNATDMVAILDADAILRYASPASRTLLGLAPEAVLGKSLLSFTHSRDEAIVRHSVGLALDKPGTNFTETFSVRHADSSFRHVEATWRDLRGEPSIDGIVMNIRDVTERKALEEKLAYRAFHDALTELPNRSLLVDRLRQSLARGERHHRGAGVVFIDLDDFKVVNDSLGHDVGDQLLVGVAQRLRASVRPGDTVARLGGDEFIVLLEDVAGESEAVSAAERCRAQLRAPFVLDGREVFIGASFGVVTSRRKGTLPEELLRQADVAMYAAKARGHSNLAVFEPAMDTSSLERLELEADLRRAVARHELTLHYQPIVDLRTQRIRGVEALLRWNHPKRGMVPPDQFIPLAEQTGLIVPLGRFVLREACRLARNWHTPRADGRLFVMSVNISGRQFQDPSLVEDVALALKDSGLNPACLKLEITESVAMEAGAATIETLQALKGLGVQLAIDDFGTGYSSLSYLKRFPVDTLKIDRSFVDGLGRNAQDTAIARSVIAIARSLELSVTAEGIERVDQLHELLALTCDEGQGYYFARPVPEQQVVNLLQQDQLGLRETWLAA